MTEIKTLDSEARLEEIRVEAVGLRAKQMTYRRVAEALTLNGWRMPDGVGIVSHEAANFANRERFILASWGRKQRSAKLERPAFQRQDMPAIPLQAPVLPIVAAQGGADSQKLAWIKATLAQTWMNAEDRIAAIQAVVGEDL